MQYAYVLSLIDADIERLQRVRQLLAEAVPPSEGAEEPSDPAEDNTVNLATSPDAPAAPAKQQRRTSSRTASRKGQEANIRATPDRQQPATSTSTDHQGAKLSGPSSGSDLDLPNAPPEASPVLRAERLSSDQGGLTQTEVRAPRRGRTRAPKPPAPTSLNRSGSTGTSSVPVFVPLEKLGQSRAKPKSKSEDTASGQSATAPSALTAELLSQRWLQKQAFAS